MALSSQGPAQTSHYIDFPFSRIVLLSSPRSRPLVGLIPNIVKSWEGDVKIESFELKVRKGGEHLQRPFGCIDTIDSPSSPFPIYYFSAMILEMRFFANHHYYHYFTPQIIKSSRRKLTKTIISQHDASIEMQLVVFQVPFVWYKTAAVSTSARTTTKRRRTRRRTSRKDKKASSFFVP